MKVLVLSCSLNSDSHSRRLAHTAQDQLRTHGAETDFLDLRELPLPFCDGETAYAHPNVAAAGARIAAADGLLVATPVYNFDVNSALKNLLELTGNSWRGKVVAFITAAGGRSSYMSVMSFANSLMLDFRCIIVPRFVYAPEVDPGDPEFGESALTGRLDQLAAELIRVAGALADKR